MNDIPETMKAMRLEAQKQPLKLEQIPVPEPGPGQVLLQVLACGVCRTDLHIVDGELPNPKLPLTPGHEIIGRVVKKGKGVRGVAPGERLGVPWLGHTDGTCSYCKKGEENLCDNPEFTGYTIDGGYAEYVVADKHYCFRVPDEFSDVDAAPLMCAGLIGYRSYRLAQAEDAERVGLYGFGAAAHILAQIAIARRQKVYAFTSPGDVEKQKFALGLGAVWAGGSDEQPPEPLDAAIIFAPVGAIVPAALRAVVKGATVACGGIHMSDIPSFPYSILWEERVLRSVANLTRKDGEDLLRAAQKYQVKVSTKAYALKDANQALDDLRRGRFEGAAVLIP